jgi:hypothetical protein
MKSFKTLLLLSAALSGFMLSACGVDPTEGTQSQDEQTQQGDAARVSSESSTGLQCLGSYQCVGPATSSPSVTVSCKWANPSSTGQNACVAACPSGTAYKSGNCFVAVVDPPPPSTLR